MKLEPLIIAMQALEEALRALSEAVREVARAIRVIFSILRHRFRRTPRDWNRRPPLIHNGRKARK